MLGIDPIILFFLFGLLAGALHSELRLPSQIYDFVIILLLLAIGMKGGVELAKQPILVLLPQMGVVVGIGVVLPFIAFPVLYFFGKFKRVDAASVAAHYGSVSVGTFAVAVAYMNDKNIAFEEYMALFVVLLEMPAIVVGILLARGIRRDTNWGEIAREVFMGKGVVLLIGGLFIGWIAGSDGLVSIKPLFFDLFKGVLALFLLEMGLIAASQLGSLKKYGVFLLGFGILMPIFSACLGAVVGLSMGLSVGGTAMLAILSASASYIAVPAAMRISVPEANPTLSLTASLGITFPFNILLGIPLYYNIAERLHSAFGGQ
ncbi:MAG: hypothetical protein ACI9Y1_003663 [Lentisphaeria bacterium]|jgi:hypothetical protein